ncbi:MAG: PucR family transcriptional regulator ligand-binding domain-containing protein [Alicyclobacillus herbarius]|uniref:PucR family transcriptional regulator n=1 Tax=Alicyclobacillus herbarius TaxID=122960 RepID=UPI0023560578|nr:PucR family transcriptional regulator [Alicyclobacillus herbarius]MCL6633542.1 PucR family transcriptional regulator ligand-binding domain-containing protein [Alicyclobacillus herbarius]
MTNTTFTVEELLRLPVMQDAKVVAGFQGAVNEIRCVDIMEIPDVRGWLRKGEFVLTTGYSFRGNPQGLSSIIEEMHKVGGAAVGFKPKRFLQVTPPDAIALSNQYRIPLIEIPPDIPYIEITQPIMERILNTQLTMMRKVYDIHSRFVNLLATQRGQELLNVLGQLLGCEAALLTSSGDVQIRTGGFSVDDVRTIRNICVDNTVLAHVALTRLLGAADVFETMCLDQVVGLLSLELTARDAGVVHSKRAREEFLAELLTGSLNMEGILVQRANQLEFPRGACRVVMIVEPLDGTGESVQKDMAHWINQAERSRLVATPLGEHVAVLYSFSDRPKVQQHSMVIEVAQDLRRKLEEHFHVLVRVAIGEARQQLRELRSSYDEARRTLNMSKKVLPEQWVVHWSDVYVEDILLSIGAHPTLERLYTNLINPIYQYDIENGTDLLHTLDVYLKHGGNTKQVATELFIHRNSVHYRLERIQDLLGGDLNSPELLFRLNLSLRAWKLGLGRGQ